MKKWLSLLLLSLNGVYAQDNLNSALDYTLSYRGLTREDITIPLELYTPGEKSPTNASKLLLPVVREIMLSPLTSFQFLDSIGELSSLNLDQLVERAFSLISYTGRVPIPAYYFTNNVNDLLDLLEIRIHEANENQKKLMKPLSKDDVSFLEKNLLSIIEETDKDDPSNMDIFKFNAARDSSFAISKRTLDLLDKLNRELIYKYSIQDLDFFHNLFLYVSANAKYLNKYFEYGPNGNYPNRFGATQFVNKRNIIIAGTEDNVYEGDYALIIDLGGNDVYRLRNSGKFDENFSCIIDLSGNDLYTTGSNYSLAGSVFACSFIFDKEGDDIYECKNVGLGSAIGGLGLVYDENGNDSYHGISLSIGSAAFGVGLIVDKNGNDIYAANSYSEGFGMTEGLGAIIDNKGNDSYLIDSRSLDIGRYEDHYVSMCQGFGLGVRPFYAGGIGLIIEDEGNDIYNTDIFGQGGAYWYALGAIIDKAGHDKYNGYQYCQGSGIHLSVGLLKDCDGWDFYQSNGVSQGCGHDFGFGMLYDVRGNDNYSAYSLSQGAGNANGIGILIDESGRDGYLNKQPEISRGYGNPRREFGSIGIFLDVSGTDFYSEPKDSVIQNTSTWGVFNDYYLREEPPKGTESAEFKVPLPDTIRAGRLDALSYSTEDYFIMAKTIEPRFSLWQEYGFNKLVEDSAAASEFILTKLATFDHRETLLMRNLARKIPYAVSSVVTGKLAEYLRRGSMEPGDAAFACYLLGETSLPESMEILLQLTYDRDTRIRSNAVNALGKIKIDTTDTEFIARAASRLTQLYEEGLGKKLYRKDIAFAFRNFRLPSNVEVLKRMLTDDYFAVRFLAQENLKLLGLE